MNIQSFMAQGTYTNAASLVSQYIPLPDKPDWFYVKEITNSGTQFNWGKASTAITLIEADWYSNMANDSYIGMGQASGTPATPTLVSGVSGGFTFIDTSNPLIYASVVGTTIDKTAFTVLTAATTGFAVGDIVRIINPTGMLQIGGLTFAITAINAGVSITLGYMATAVGAGLTIAANATACSIQKVLPLLYYPKKREIMYVDRTANKIYFSRPNDYTPGEWVDFYVPTTYGTIQLTKNKARVLSVVNSATESSIVIDKNCSGFSAFVMPTSALFKAGPSPAICVPAGSGVIPLAGSATIPAQPPGTNLADAFDNLNKFYMQIGTSACGAASATMQWFAFKA